jgi:hypothetical protein
MAVAGGAVRHSSPVLLNWGMVVLGAVLAVVVAAGCIGLLARRRAGAEVSSVEGYQHTLATLEGIRSRADQRGVRPGEPAAPGGGAAGSPAPSAPSADRAAADRGAADDVAGGRDVAGTTADRGRRLVFDSASSVGHFERDRRPATTAPGPVQLSPLGQHRALSAMNHGPRRVGGPILVALIVLGLVGVVVEIGLHQKPKPAAAHAHTATTAYPARHTTGTGRTASHAGSTSRTGTSGGSGRTHATGGTAASRSHHRHTSATTTPTAPTSFTASNVTANGATYAVPAGSYSLSLATTNGPCWIFVTNSAGSTVFTETMPPGSRHSLTASGALQVELGAPGAISVEVDGRPLVLPNGYRSPFTMSVQPAG